ncbi:putative ParB-like partition protein [Methanocella paludicola SANAE]|uniref:ParB-like partition protein n=1 Tax=Methanocella paludicola (strain DSM 17711 / JCM 13418 / NBRC 101707 / SANAE) TaxID=304371 RepID=D1YWZ8_METPS|nr:ParB/RepB/Spo0J family partition protein [Methanocella paludicola]BAI60970.1 putative ParB-like partition protein [Methanocella paludicola SANAE]
MKTRSKSNASDFLTIHIKRISIDPTHIRRNVKDIKELKSTIADVGLLQPILVRQTNRGYTVVDGARRLEALKELGIEELIIGKDVIVETAETEADEKFKQLIANVQREDINDIELGHAFVALNEGYGYQFKEMAEIIEKTPHYVAAKVGLAKRLVPVVQSMVISDWQSAKCSRNTSRSDIDDVVPGPYLMNVNVIEDIARLPAELQQAAYETIKDKEMDKKEALRYLKTIKEDAEVLKMADDVKGHMQACSEEDEGHEKELKRYLKKIDRDLEKLSVTIKAGNDIDRRKVVSALKALIERLNQLYSEVNNDPENKALV